ncbi:MULTISPECIES: hypothetical protein [Bradyrhizobium]|uniref:hypothetical protein n=1 Tax=Bradyrhizobium TaxID=374 RepID=UPI00056F68E0|nr:MULTISPECIES: hypothetical protein [Bradyrhizobium]MCW2130459.1 hypothetical protein [Bradyrhizobium elkanii]MCW2175535.1 hypothetical protein [Bradyrhizobium elkanii]MDI2108570.1 hypothetical protein [Bradyrhizobium sp. Mp64]
MANEPDTGRLAERLRSTLLDVMRQRRLDFSGIGIIVCDQPDYLPLVPLSTRAELPESSDLVSSLVRIASRSNHHHDGFHVLSTKWQLTRVAQYFSPPLVPTAEIDRSKRFGGRYLAALFGSSIDGVILTGIASEGLGIVIFCDGREIRFGDQG